MQSKMRYITYIEFRSWDSTAVLYAEHMLLSQERAGDGGYCRRQGS